MKKTVWANFSDINQTIKFLTLSDVILLSALGLFGPIFAVYLSDKFSTDDALEVIGVGTSIYLFTRSLGQIPLAYVIDKIKGEHDDYVFLLIGSLIFVIVPLLYIAVSEPWHLFLVQFVYGIGSAITFPSWYAIFTRHVDKGKEGIEWGIYQTFVDLGGAIAAPIGALIASLYGFTTVLICASTMSLFAIISISLIKDDLKKRT